jgi:hypothetical protein
MLTDAIKALGLYFPISFKRNFQYFMFDFNGGQSVRFFEKIPELVFHYKEI